MNKIISLILLLLLTAGLQSMVFANSTVGELQKQMEEKNKEIELIKDEINKYREEINKTGEEQKSLKNEIQILQTRASKLKSEISLTNKQIDSTNFVIQKLKIEIENKNEQIENSKKSLAEILRKLDEEESRSLIEILLAHNSLSDFFVNIERMEYLQKDINANLADLKILKNEFEENQTQKDAEKNKLEQLQDNLGDQKELVGINKQQKDNLLKQTQNKEQNYKKILEDKIAKKELFLSELADLEAQLQIEIDPDSIPSAGTGILGYPLSEVSLLSCWNGGGEFQNCVTQFFGNTPFATQNPQVYGGKGHNGVDFRASVGEKVFAASGGVIESTGNTDEIRGCYSYGKWVLIKHNNGLSTLYAHLSLIKVNQGQQVSRGQIIGYSGETGYATGPHLHFTVYATQGVKIMRLGDIKTITNCANARIPIADKKAYLNPLSYF